MRNLLDNLEEADMNFDEVVSTNVYLNDLAEVQGFDDVYGQYFGPVAPARTVVQQIASTDRKPDKDGHYPDLEQVSVVAVKKRFGH
jgi:enamine deaminase RidA (YjgF/YER057c/UK114 family)